jgi:hypothetical protein
VAIGVELRDLQAARVSRGVLRAFGSSGRFFRGGEVLIVRPRTAFGDTCAVEWFEQVRTAEELEDWDTAIALVSAHAECFSADFYAHDNHLRHMDLLVRAEWFTKLTELARVDVHARRRLNRSLCERGMDATLRQRAEDGDRGALYSLVRLLCERSRIDEARQAVLDIDPENLYGYQVLARY